MPTYLPKVLNTVDPNGLCGTGNLKLNPVAGAGFNEIASMFMVTDTQFYYQICCPSGQIEFGIGTVSANILSRVTVLQSTNNGERIDVQCSNCDLCDCIVQSYQPPTQTYKGNTAPANPQDAEIWIDTSCHPMHQEKRYCEITGTFACVKIYDATIENCVFENCICGEVASGVVDGTNKVFTIANNPTEINSVSFGGGQVLFTHIGNEITVLNAPYDCEKVVVDYCYPSTDCPEVYTVETCEDVVVPANASNIVLNTPPATKTVKIYYKDTNVRLGEFVHYNVNATGITLLETLPNMQEYTICYKTI